MAWARLDHSGDVFVALAPNAPINTESLADTITRHLAAATGWTYWHTTAVHPTSGVITLWFREASQSVIAAGALAGPGIAWGSPVGSSGPATEGELSTAITQPTTAAALLGRFVLLAPGPQSVRLVSSVDLVHTLVCAEGPAGRAYSNLSVPALLAAGSPLRINEAAIAERIFLDYVTGDDELLAGVRTTAPGTVVDLSRDRVPETTFVSTADLLAPIAPLTPQAFRQLIGAELVRLAAVPHLQLALTSGRDSSLVLSCLVETGVELPTFTMGVPAMPDVAGASASAARAGVAHRLLSVGPEPPAAPSYARAVAGSGWTAGLDSAWNLVSGKLSWDGPAPVSWLSGSGGETGRAFYWGAPLPNPSTIAAARDVLRSQLANDIAPVALGHLHDRVLAAFDTCATDSADPAGGLDLLYVRGRMRKWLMRTIPRIEVAGFSAAFTSPAVTRALLAIPADQKQSGAFFDAALAAFEPNFADLARTAGEASAAQWAATFHANPVPRTNLLRRLRDRRAAPPPEPFPPIAEVLAQMRPDGLARATTGPAWWSRVVAASGHDRTARRWLWNAIAVDALADWVAEQSAP